MASRALSRKCLHLSHHAPAADVFLHVASRRSVHTQPVLEFLAPRFDQRSLRRVCRLIGGSWPGGSITACRAFSGTHGRRATVAILNPKKDEDGHEMVVDITPRASKRLKEIMAKDANPDLALKITVESGGCHGFQYLMSLTTLPPLDAVDTAHEAVTEENAPGLNASSADANATTPAGDPSAGAAETLHKTPNTPASFNTKPKKVELSEDDTVFAAMDGSGAKVLMDGPSLELLRGSKIDYTTELIGSQFKIVDNPLASSSCGCGTSFDIKA